VSAANRTSTREVSHNKLVVGKDGQGRDFLVIFKTEGLVAMLLLSGVSMSKTAQGWGPKRFPMRVLIAWSALFFGTPEQRQICTEIP